MRRAGELTLLLAVGCTCAGPERRPLDRLPGDETGVFVPSSSGGPTGETGVPAPLEWVALDAGFVFSCGLLNDQRIVCWGDDESVAATPDDRFVAVSIGGYGGCGLRADATVSCWCTNAADQSLCQGVPRGAGFVRIEEAAFWGCAEDEERMLECWGLRAGGRGNVPEVPVLHWDIEENVGCAVLDDGSVSCWGAGTRLWSEAEPPPAVAPPADRKYTQVAVGRTHACALDTGGEVHCWGRTAIQTPFPPAPPGPFEEVIAWNQVTCAFRRDRTAECWYDLPQLWDTDDEPPEADGGPKWEPPPGLRWAQIGLGEWDACGLTVDGEAHCWMPGTDTSGEVSELPALEDL